MMKEEEQIKNNLKQKDAFLQKSLVSSTLKDNANLI
jgi:hypothetical protein